MPASRTDRLANSSLVLFKVSIAIVLISYVKDFVSYKINQEDFEEVIRWLEIHSPGTGWQKNKLYNAGVVRLEKLCLLTTDELAPLGSGYIPKYESVQIALVELKRHMILKFWLKESYLERNFDNFVNAGFDSLQRIVSKLDYSGLEHFLVDDTSHAAVIWERVGALKKQSNVDFDNFPVEEQRPLLLQFISLVWTIANYLARIFLVIFILGVIFIIALGLFLYFLLVRFIQNFSSQRFYQVLQNAVQSVTTSAHTSINQSQPSSNNPNQPMSSNNDAGSHSIWQSFFNLFAPRRTNTPRFPFNPSHTRFEFSWDEGEAVVGEMRSFVVKFYSMFLISCPNRKISNARAEITVNGNPVPLTMEENSEHSFLVKFTPVVAAPHKISFHAMGQSIKTFHKGFLPGAVDPSKTSVSIKSSILVLKPSHSAFITLDECDKFGNKCKSSEETLSKYLFTVTKLKDRCPIVRPAIAVTHLIDKYVLMMTLSEPGCYKVVVEYQDTPIANNVFTMIVLQDEKWDLMMSEIKKPSLNICYEAYLISDDQETKSKKVYIYLTPKQLFIREWYWIIFHKRLHSIRVRTTLKLSLLPKNDAISGHPLMTIHEPGKSEIQIACKDRDLLIATYSQLLLRKAGGSDNFESKRSHLYSELRKTYERKSNQRADISINRNTILLDSMKATRGFNDSDWGKQLIINFTGEYGQDLGGPRREWFHILCHSLFSPGNHFFCKSGKNDAQSLVHPNPVRPESHKKLKYYEFAGKLVGKMVIECAFGRPHYVMERFSRAFLSQIIGLDVSWRHFESDDKELYKTKIQYVLNNDPEDLELTFTEDIYDERQNFIKTIELTPSGTQIKVTEDNKLNYLHLMADYRLAKCVKDEIASFRKGLTSLVSENLLSIFDENELELLICGTEHIDPLDLKKNFTKCMGGGYSLDKVLGWFWEIVFGMSQEEMARLLQFTTGSSQVPPGGFKELVPKFQINFHPGRDILPTAHTCFNMLCLPDYSSKGELQRLLFIALNEGSEGFGLV